MTLNKYPNEEEDEEPQQDDESEDEEVEETPKIKNTTFSAAEAQNLLAKLSKPMDVTPFQSKVQPIKVVSQKPTGSSTTILKNLPEVTPQRSVTCTPEPTSVNSKDQRCVTDRGVTNILNNLDSSLLNDDIEDPESFQIQSIYAQRALQMFPGQVNEATAEVLGRMMVNKVKLGVTYGNEIEPVLQYLTS